MAQLPEHIDPTLEAVNRAIEAAQDTSRRGYLGASAIGDNCSRKLWYAFRWACPVSFDADTLKRFEDGHRGEAVMAERLRKVPGLQLSTEREDGEQWGFVAIDGHFRGHCDGFLLGILQAPKTPHVWEHKVCNEAKQKKLAKLKLEKGEKEALAHWDQIYYAQAQVYMHQFEITRHYLTCSSPGERTTVSVRTNYNREHAEYLMDRAQGIIYSEEEPARLSETPTDYRCKMCDFHGICHEQKPFMDSCRTCVYSAPGKDGKWDCKKHGALDRAQQAAMCADFASNFVPF